MSGRRFLRTIRRDSSGAVALEFAIVGPAMIAMLLGVMQIGIGMQNYNALRNVSTEVARYAMVQYATGNNLTNDQLNAYAYNVGESAPYLLKNSRLVATVTDAATQRVTGATEKKLVLEYQIPSFLEPMGLRGPRISYVRPLFVTTPGT
jgi:Flp pilus assembly protein TadG